MNKLEYELLSSYLEQLSLKTQNTINGLQLVQKHIDGFKSQFSKRDISEKTRTQIPLQALSIEQPSNRSNQPNDLIKIKEVIQMTSLSRSSIYTLKNTGEFPKPIKLSSHSIAWVRSDIDKWILHKIQQ